MALGAVFKRPFDEQVAFFRGKLGNLIPTEKWTDVWKSAHDTGFMVAGAAKADLLADLAGAVDRAISEGTGIDAFRKDFDKIVAKHGWSYRGEYNWRTRTIYRTNMATSYAAGRLVQLKDGGFPFWMYRHSDSVARPRPLHVSWNKLALPANDAWWQTHYPPNGWGCQCYVIGVSRKMAERMGGRITDAPDDGTAPDGTPKGIDKGWDYMPGATTTEQTRRSLAEKAASLPTGIAQGLISDIEKVGATDKFALPAFREAKTIKEAERFAQEILDTPNPVPYRVDPADGLPEIRFTHGVPLQHTVEAYDEMRRTKVFGKADYSGLDLVTANVLNKTLIDMQLEADLLGIPRLRRIKSGSGRSLASMGDGVLSVSKNMRFQKGPASTAAIGDTLKQKPFTANAYFDRPIAKVENSLWHEFGHHIHQQFKVGSIEEYKKPPLEKALDAFTHGKMSRNTLSLPSKYAATNAKEYFAECYSLYRMGRSDLIDSDTMALIKSVEKGEMP